MARPSVNTTRSRSLRGTTVVGFKQKALFPKPNLPFSRFIKWSHRLPVLPIVVDGGWVSGPLHSKTIPVGNTSRIPSRWYHRFSLRETRRVMRKAGYRGGSTPSSCALARLIIQTHAFLTQPCLHNEFKPELSRPSPAAALASCRAVTSKTPRHGHAHARLCHVATSNQQRYNQCKHSTPNPTEHFSLPGRRRRRCRPPTRPINLHTGSLGPHGGARAREENRAL